MGAVRGAAVRRRRRARIRVVGTDPHRRRFRDDRRLAPPRSIAWRYAEDGTWERIDLAPPVEGVGLGVGGVIETDDGLVIIGSTSDSDTGEGSAYIWVEP